MATKVDSVMFYELDHLKLLRYAKALYAKYETEREKRLQANYN